MTTSELNKLYRIMKDGMEINEACTKLDLDQMSLMGAIEILKSEGYRIDILEKEDKLYIKKRLNYKTDKEIKPELKNLELIRLCIVSDTHMGCKMQQLTFLNKVYEETYRRGITTVLHCGDIVDGDYANKRPAWKYQLFAQGHDEQRDNVVNFYPSVEGIETYFICGSHDDTHFLNGGADIGKNIADKRSDLHYLGMDKAVFMAGENKNVPILMTHPGGGVSKALSYKPQEAINKLETGLKPKILLQGHYHKSYYMFYRNIHAFMVPCLVGLSPFMRRMDIQNIMGAYFLDIYVNEKGEIQFLQPEEYLFDSKDEIIDDYKKAKQLVIKK